MAHPRNLMSLRSQRVILWWAIAMTVTYGILIVFAFHMVPPPSATWSAERVAAFYTEHHDSIRIGAVIAGWTSAFFFPLSMVIGIQMARIERGPKIWTAMTIAGGAMMSIFLVLPPIFWGVAAFTADRSPEVTLLMHELSLLTLTTTDQYYIFIWVAIVVMCFVSTNVKHSPFPRWFGYFTAWVGFMFEAGALAFLPRTGVFAWDGLLVFWSPLTLFGLWITVQCVLLFKAIRGQIEDADADELVESAPVSA